MRLYDIAEQFAEVQKLAESDESMMQAVLDTMEGIEAEFNEKAIAIVSVSFNMEADVAAIDAQIKRLKDRKDAIINRTEDLRRYLKDNMARTGIKKISCPLFSITLCDPLKQVEIANEKELPDEYVSVETKITPDKRKILAALKEGVEIPGANLVDGAQRLLIK